ncbi:heparan-alpha-glucosaminide N-acetyltransferase domain-containing protein [Nocardioides sp.]|uniref:heparan-alpha-glucosaminide N-acetyltransferase domain-containing protein n=1 Tax=Nocardioides sp. TaxID=35761 RepID=UPI002723F2DB|nr:heparan-alpha-glucosaminide N-acetyltransferase domain-containing protein [Nocardioides sp.]MDO9458153.1 heparan-alpha-glucosaminide N-acetyltransferase domain-containing protein [Nocardioides sp.]
MGTSVAAGSASSSRARLVGLDVARCLALLGMMATHVLAARTPDGDLATSHVIASGRASALFAVLAGVAMALVSGRRTPVRGGERVRASLALLVRAVAVAALGLVLGVLGTGIAVILTYYAVLFVLGLPFLGLTWKPLLALAVGWAVVAPVVSRLVVPELPARQFESPRPDQLGDPGRLLSELLLTGYYPAVPWLTYLLLGLAIGRLDLQSRRVAAGLAAGGAVVAVAATLVSDALTSSRFTAAELDAMAGGMYGQTPVEGPDSGWRWLTVVAPHSTTPFDLLQTAGSAAAVIGLCLLLVAWVSDLSRHGERAVQVLFGAGTMTLTLYTVHLLMKTEQVWPDDVPSSYVWHVVVVLWVGSVYAALQRQGPLEWAVGVVPRRIRGRAGSVRR